MTGRARLWGPHQDGKLPRMQRGANLSREHRCERLLRATQIPKQIPLYPIGPLRIPPELQTVSLTELLDCTRPCAEKGPLR